MRTRTGWIRGLLLTVVAGGACANPVSAPPPPVAPEGPPVVELSAVSEHARQFDRELPERAAGSQQEFAAATYITGHLQRAGYEVRLASVPFKDLVRSTNVVALPARRATPQAIVTVAYDTLPVPEPRGRDIGLFLEIARALRVRDPHHQVGFVALGAEVTGESGGNLGSRSLASELATLDHKPPVIALLEVPGGGFDAIGPGSHELDRIARAAEVAPLPRPPEALSSPLRRSGEIFAEAGVAHIVAAGGLRDLGPVVLAYLSAR